MMRYSKVVDTNHAGSLLLSVLISFFPKCAFCWAAYLSVFSTFGIASIPYAPWLKPAMIAIFIVNFVTLFIIARRQKKYGSFIVGALGAMLIIVASLLDYPILIYVGLTMIIASGLSNVITKNLACKV